MTNALGRHPGYRTLRATRDHGLPHRPSEVRYPIVSVKTPEQGAATSVLLAASPLIEGVSGRYFEDCHEAEVVPAIVGGIYGVRDYALDPDAAERLWDESRRLPG